MQSHESTERYLTTFKQHYANGAALSPAWLKPIREAAIARFKEVGFPTTRDEDWKYTSLDRIASRAMFLERTALRAMSSFFTRFLPGIADAVPARATQSATKATIIEGDGR